MSTTPDPPESGSDGSPEPNLPDLPELREDFDFDAEFAKAFGTEPPETGESPTRPKSVVAVVLTPVSSAPALAGLCAMAKIDAHVVPTSRGALAVRVIERDDAADDSLAELLGEAPEIAMTMAATLSRTSRYGAVLLVSRLGEGDEGLVGTIAASQWNNGERAEGTVSAGLVLAQSDDVVEQLLFGTTTPEEAEGAISPGTLPPWQARRLFKKTQRKPRP